MADKPKSVKIEATGKMTAKENPDGSVSLSGGEAANIHLETIKSVGIENLVDVEVHTINFVFGSVSHYIKFFGGGEIQFSYNSQGEILEFTAKNVDAEVQNGERLFLKRQRA